MNDLSTGREAIEQEIARGRASRPAAVNELRAAPRYSIAELNEMDPDQLAERMRHMRYDNTGPVNKFLDLLDLGRNPIVSHIFPGASARAKTRAIQRGDYNSITGMPKVMGSDIAEELGVHSQVARAAIGLGIDLAFDPLTYLGPGAVEKIGGAAFARSGGRAVKAGLNDLKAGREIADPLVRKLYDAHVVPHLAKDADAATKAAAYSERIYGKIGKKDAMRVGGKAEPTLAEWAARPADLSTLPDEQLAKVDAEFRKAYDLTKSGTDATDYMKARREMLKIDDAKAASAKDLIWEHGKGGKFSTLSADNKTVADKAARFDGRQGFLFGNAGSQVAHIPWTDFGISVPAFTGPARAAVAARARALVKESRFPEAAGIMRAFSVVDKIPQTIQDLEKAQGEIDNLVRLKELGGTDVDGQIAKAIEARDALRGSFRDATMSLKSGVEYERMLQDAAKAGSIAEVQTLERMADTARAYAQHFDRTVEASPFWDLIQKQSKSVDRSEVFAKSPYLKMRDSLIADARTKAEAEPVVRGLDTEIDNVSAMHPYAVGKRKAVDDAIAAGADKDAVKQLRKEWRESIKEVRQQAEGFSGPLHHPHEHDIAEAIATKRQAVNQLADWNIARSYTDNQRAITELSDRNIDDMLAAADATHAYADSLYNLSSRTKAPLAGAVSKQFDLLSESAKHALGLDDSMMGYSLFAPIRSVMQTVFGDGFTGDDAMRELDRAKRIGFGNRRAVINELPARYLALRTGGAIERADLELRHIGDQFKSIVHNPEYGIKPAQHDDLRTYLTIKALLRRPAAGDAYDLLTLDGKPGPLLEALERLRSKGTFDNKKLVAELESLADSANAHLDMMGDSELAQGLLGQKMAAYLPNVMDPAYARRVAEHKASGGGLSDFEQAASESFQNPRQTIRYRFTDSEGKRREFFQFDTHLAAKSDDEIKALPTAQARKRAEEVRETIKEFRKLHKGIDEDRWPALFGKPIDPIELNSLKSQGVFNHLTGAEDAAEKVFSDNLLYMLQQRTGSHLRAVARKEWQDMFRPYALNMNQVVSDEKVNTVGKTYAFQNGTKAVSLGQNRLLVGDKVYRKLPSGVAKSLEDDESLMGGLMEHMDYSAWYPEQVVEQVERIADMAKPDNANIMLRAMADINKAWKGFTLLHLSWPIGNIVGNVMNMVLGRTPLKALSKYANDSVKAAWHMRDPEFMASHFFDIRGQKVSYADLLKQLEAHGGIGSGQAGEAMAHIYPTGEFKPVEETLSFADRVKAMPGQVRGIPENVKGDYFRRLNESLVGRGLGANPTRADKFKAGMAAMQDQRYIRRVFGAWAAVNGAVENSFKLAAYAGFLDEGLDAAEAARRVREVLFDYTDMTVAERSARRYFVPFYAWIRNNGAYQVHQFLQNPKFAAGVPKLKEAIEEMVAGDEKTPEWARPQWLREELGVQIMNDPAKALTLGSLVTTEPVNRLGGALTGTEGLMNLLRFGGSMMAPLPQMALSLGQGREFYTGRTIGANEAEGDLSAGEFIASQFRPVRELLPLGLRTPPLVKAAQEGPASFAGRALLGGRLQPFDKDRLGFATEREFTEQESQIRKFINVAEREGNKEASLRGRAKLMGLYQERLKRGLKIPVWAKKQLVSAQENRP